MQLLVGLCSALICMGYQPPQAIVPSHKDVVSSTHIQIMICVDDSEVFTVLSDICSLPDGRSTCAGRVKSQGQSWNLEWDFILDLDARKGGSIRGKTVWMNSGNQPQSCVLKILFPLDPVIHSGAEVHSSVGIHVVSDGRSGKAEVLKDGSGWEMLVDGRGILSMMDYPLFLTSSNSKKITAREHTGGQNEWSHVGGITDSLGVESQWSIGSRDSLVVSTQLRFRGQQDQFLKRRDTTSAIVIGLPETTLRIRTGSSANGSSVSSKKVIKVRPHLSRDGNRIERNK